MRANARNANYVLDGETVVHDLNSNQVLGRISGVVAPPVGAEIELVSPNINVAVERVRLLVNTVNDAVTVCLDVRVSD